MLTALARRWAMLPMRRTLAEPYQPPLIFQHLLPSQVVSVRGGVKEASRQGTAEEGTEGSLVNTVFVYGVFKSGEPNHAVIADKATGVASLKGVAQTQDRWPLVIASKYNIPYLLYTRGIGHHVVGEVYEMDDRKLARFDDLEGHPAYYERELIPVVFIDSKAVVTCWGYFLKDYRPHLLRLPFLKEYSSSGPHNMPYIPSGSDDRSSM